MLTDNEKRWLQLRELYAGVNYDSYYSCMHCKFYNVGRWRGFFYPCNEACLSNGCPFIDIESKEAVYDYIDAADFDAMVAAKLADPYYPPMDSGSDGPQLFMPPADRLKWARIEVEEEMNDDKLDG